MQPETDNSTSQGEGAGSVSGIDELSAEVGGFDSDFDSTDQDDLDKEFADSESDSEGLDEDPEDSEDYEASDLDSDIEEDLEGEQSEDGEESEEGEEGSEESFQVSEDDLSAKFQLSDGSEVTLGELLQARDDAARYSEDSYKQKHQELDNRRQEYDAKIEELGFLAEHQHNFDVSMNALAEAAVENGFMSKDFHARLDALFAQGIQNGELDINGARQFSDQQSVLRQQVSAQQEIQDKQVDLQVKADLYDIGIERNGPLSESERRLISEYVNSQIPAQNRMLSVREAYDALVESGKITPANSLTSATSKKKINEHIRRSAKKNRGPKKRSSERVNTYQENEDAIAAELGLS